MEKILIVEDDASNNQMLKEYLESHGYVCTQAYSGSEGKLLFSMEKYDLVLLDLMLPGIPGEELVTLPISRHEQGPSGCRPCYPYGNRPRARAAHRQPVPNRQLPPVVPPALVSSAADRERGTALCTAGRLLGRAAFQACFSQIAYKRKTRPASTRPGAFLIVESTKPSAPIRRVTPLRRLPCAAGWCPPAERLCTEC